MIKDKIVLEAVTGSIAYGLNHANSDVDKMGIFVAKTEKVAGLDWHSKDESWSDAGPTGDDTSYHEIGKYLRLVLGSNPTLIELLFLEDYLVLDEVGQGIVSLKDSILYETGVRSAYYGYAKSQLVRVDNDGPENFKPKMARHTLRIARQGAELLTTGTATVRVPNPQEYFDLTEMRFEAMIEELWRGVDSIRTVDSILPEKPGREKVREFLEDVRRNNIG